jgi:hypothetical protein
MIFRYLADKLRLYGNKRVAAALLLLVSLLGLGSAAQQHRKTHKLRAVALLELTTDTKGKTFAHLTAVTLYDQGQLYDGSVYKAKPAPMALDTGVIYEAQRTGLAVGNVTISSGESRRGVWTATGNWRPVETQTKPEAPAPVPAAATPAADDRPILRKPGSTPAPASIPAAAPAPSPVKAGPSTEQAGDDSERPRLARKPIPQPADVAKPEKEAAGPPVTRQILVAVSDAQTSDSRSYEFPWKPEEKTKIEAQMRQLAAAQFPRELHISANALAKVVIRSFDTDMSNDAVEVLTAEVPGTGSGAAKAATGKPVTHYVTLIARVDIDGGPQKVAALVTDSSRLDVVPRYELIDAVDVDGSNVADILFRAYSFDQQSLVLYSVGRSSATKVFDGASQPLP